MIIKFKIERGLTQMSLEQLSGEIKKLEYLDEQGYLLHVILTIQPKSGDVRRIVAPYDTTKDPIIPSVPLETGVEINGLKYFPLSDGKLNVGRKVIQVDGIAHPLYL